MARFQRAFEGPPTFMKLETSDIQKDVDIGFIGVAFDLGVTNNPGARHGPASIRRSSMMIRDLNHYNKIEPKKICNVADLGDVPFEYHFDIEKATNEICDYFKKIKEHNIVPLAAGGDHSISYPILKALGEEEPLALIHFDAHCDTVADLGGSTFHHGSPFRNAVLSNSIDPKSTVQIGIRGTAEPYWEFSYTSGMKVLHVEECCEMVMKKLIERIKDTVGEKKTYLSFDVDALDPAFAPGTGTPEIGGFTSREVLQVIRGLRGLNLVGADLVEVSPALDTGTITSLLGANLMFEMLCIIADSLKP